MMALLRREAPGGDWGYEVKFDGYRAVGFREKRGMALISRNAKDLAGKFPEVAQALARLTVRDAVVDGEIVALDEAGRSSFQLLQAYELGETRPPLAFYLFDLLRLNGRDWRNRPLEERKEALQALLPADDPLLRFSPILGDDPDALLETARKHRLEGLIGKRAGSSYESGRRTGTWIKLKLLAEQEFVIGGYTEPEGSRRHFGALLVGYHRDGVLEYAGKVGTGFTEARLRELAGLFRPLESAEVPFAGLPEKRSNRWGQGLTAAAMRRCHWLRPVLVAQIEFAEWTNDGHLRQPVFLGLRHDKKAAAVIRELPV